MNIHWFAARLRSQLEFILGAAGTHGLRSPRSEIWPFLLVLLVGRLNPLHMLMSHSDNLFYYQGKLEVLTQTVPRAGGAPVA